MSQQGAIFINLQLRYDLNVPALQLVDWDWLMKSVPPLPTPPFFKGSGNSFGLVPSSPSQLEHYSPTGSARQNVLWQICGHGMGQMQTLSSQRGCDMLSGNERGTGDIGQNTAWRLSPFLLSSNECALQRVLKYYMYKLICILWPHWEK